MTVKEAKDFFSRKITESADRENIAFDSLEKQMLYWTAEHEDPELADKFAKSHNDADFEKKVGKLLKSSYAYDREHDPDELEKYKEAYRALRQGDHYLLVMLNASIGGKLKGKDLSSPSPGLEGIHAMDIIKSQLYFLKLSVLGGDVDPKNRIDPLLRVVIGLISVSMLYFPVFSLIQHGTHDFWNHSAHATLLKLLSAFGLIFGIISIRGEFSPKWFLPWWMK